MRITIFLIFILFTTPLQSQINGNGNIITKIVELDAFDELLVNLNIDLDVICSGSEAYAEITTDENLIPYVALINKSGRLEITQKKWIEFSKGMTIRLYAPDLKKVVNDSWADLAIYNLDKKSFDLYSEISEVKLQGYVEELTIGTDDAKIDMTKLEYLVFDGKVTGKGYITMNEKGDKMVKKNRKSRIFTEAELSDYINQPIFKNADFINIKVKNNSFRGFSAYVKGPKKDGNYFSYGLNFSALQTKSEKWSVGTKLYKVGKFGSKKLLYTVAAEDEGKTVKLFDK